MLYPADKNSTLQFYKPSERRNIPLGSHLISYQANWLANHILINFLCLPLGGVRYTCWVSLVDACKVWKCLCLPKTSWFNFLGIALILAVISLQLLQHRIPLPLNCAETPYLSPLSLQSFPPIPCVGKNKCRLNWLFLCAVRNNPFLSSHPSSSSDFLYHGSFGSASGAALASLHAHALVLPHLLRCSYQSCFGQHLNDAQLPLCSEGLLLSTVCTWVGLLIFSSAKKVASFRKGFTWNSFVDWFQGCLTYRYSFFTA